MTAQTEDTLRVLHLSDTPLSGAPIRLSQLLADHGGIESRHICWKEKIGYREFDTDIIGRKSTLETMRYLIYEWSDVIHYHNRWKRQEIFKALKMAPPSKPSVIQIHSPRESENFSEEVASGIPLAIVAQYHVRQWAELSYIVPNVVDITRKDYQPRTTRDSDDRLPIVSYAPSNTNAKGWDDKGYNVVAPVLKRLKLDHKINYQLIQQKPFREVMNLKKSADIGIDEVITGSYHLSALEYLAVGVPCLTGIDEKTEAVVKELTGCIGTPFIKANKSSFGRIITTLVKEKNWGELGKRSREWMQNYWSPELLCGHYLNMYKEL